MKKRKNLIEFPVVVLVVCCRFVVFVFVAVVVCVVVCVALSYTGNSRRTNIFLCVYIKNKRLINSRHHVGCMLLEHTLKKKKKSILESRNLWDNKIISMKIIN